MSFIYERLYRNPTNISFFYEYRSYQLNTIVTAVRIWTFTIATPISARLARSR